MKCLPAGAMRQDKLDRRATYAVHCEDGFKERRIADASQYEIDSGHSNRIVVVLQWVHRVVMF
jgi:hypothetical protein